MERVITGLKSGMAAMIAIGLTALTPVWSQTTTSASPAGNWVATWSSAPMPPGSAFLPPVSFDNQTIRQVVHISAGGGLVRVRLSNAYGATPLVIGAAHVALSASGSSIVPGSDHTLTFNGQTSIMIPTGALALSDPVLLPVPSLANLAISIYVPNNTGSATYHESADQTGYISGPGNFTATTTFPTVQTDTSRYWLTGVDVAPLVKVNAVVAFGDSITEGFHSTVDADRRWPDDLSARVNSPFGIPRLAVLNQGIGCSRMLFDFCGPNGSSRFDRDVLAQTGVTHLIVDLGFTDIVFTPANEAERQAVDQWIRTSGAYDGIVDFDAALRDPSDPARLLLAYASSDNTHPNDAGYAAMANAIDLSLLR